MSRAWYIFLLIFIASFSNGQTNDSIFDLTDYDAQTGLTASVENETLTIQWKGVDESELRVNFGIKDGVPVIKNLSIRNGTESWTVIASDVTPEFRVVTGLRRVTMQQTEPLEELGVPLTAEKLNEIKWHAFWDAPLYLDDKPPLSHASSIPAAKPFANHPGLPRKPEEVTRALATFHASECKVRTNGARLEITFQGVELGIFTGYLQYDIFKGSNLIRQMVVARTEEPSVAFKYDGGLKGFRIQDDSRIVWRDLQENWTDYNIENTSDHTAVVVKGANRLISAELEGGAIAAFPPPHRFYWARETEQVLGYGWYRKDDDATFSFGIRQAEIEEDPEFYHNFALYNARPGEMQRMPVFLYVSPSSGKDAIQQALKFTHGDHFKPLPGYKVMGSHYHVGLVERLKAAGGFDKTVNDIEAIKSAGIDIFGVVDGPRGPGRHDKGELFLNDLAEYYEAARSQSNSTFLLMPENEESTSGRGPFLGGHYEMLMSHPVYWAPARKPGQPMVELHPKFGQVYHLGSPEDMMEMARRENIIISMPHPRAKRSTGFPDAIKDEPHFLHPNYFGLGYRWGMGINGSEIRLGESRFLPLWNEVNNWMASKDLPPKFAIAISEGRSDKGDRGKPKEDDIYGMSPVNYLKIDAVPSLDDMSPIVNALKNGKYFVTSGEVLIPYYTIEGAGKERTIVAEVEWTFPLDFVEIVWGDGAGTGRTIISTTELPPFGRKRFEIPFEGNDKKWIRFAAWDVAGNGAMVQPVLLTN